MSYFNLFNITKNIKLIIIFFIKFTYNLNFIDNLDEGFSFNFNLNQILNKINIELIIK